MRRFSLAQVPASGAPYRQRSLWGRALLPDSGGGAALESELPVASVRLPFSVWIDSQIKGIVNIDFKGAAVYVGPQVPCFPCLEVES